MRAISSTRSRLGAIRRSRRSDAGEKLVHEDVLRLAPFQFSGNLQFMSGDLPGSITGWLATFGGQSIGLHLQERDLDFRR